MNTGPDLAIVYGFAKQLSQSVRINSKAGRALLYPSSFLRWAPKARNAGRPQKRRSRDEGAKQRLCVS